MKSTELSKWVIFLLHAARLVSGRGTYQTIFGAVVIERSVYQQAGRGRLRIPPWRPVTSFGPQYSEWEHHVRFAKTVLQVAQEEDNKGDDDRVKLSATWNYISSGV